MQNGRLALGAFGPTFWISALARFELVGAGRFAVTDVVVVGGGPGTFFGWVF